MHKTITILLALLPLTFASCGGGSPHADLLEEQNSHMTDFVEALKGITDEESAKAAHDKLKSIGENLAATAKRMEALGEPDIKEREKLMKDASDMAKTAMQVSNEIQRVSSISGAQETLKVIQEAMASMSQ